MMASGPPLLHPEEFKGLFFYHIASAFMLPMLCSLTASNKLVLVQLFCGLSTCSDFPKYLVEILTTYIRIF